jgi:hypoxanthine phosphoribosyltransferase
MNRDISLLDKTFTPYLSSESIRNRIHALATQLNADYKGESVVFIGVLNGAFMFASDLMKGLDLNLEISFVKVSSYSGTQSSGIVKELIGLNNSINDKHVIVIEDIVDTGRTADKLFELLHEKTPRSIEMCTLLFKPNAFEGKMVPKYVGFTIPNKFVVGFGLDYDEVGRNLNEIYQLNE